MATPLNILIAEDSQNDADLVLHELHRAGFDPKWKRVQTEADFLTELKTLPDIVISDYSMPQFSGLRAVELLQKSGLNIPFILISGTVGEDIAVKAMQHGATDYLLKDRLTRLGQAVERALREAKERAELKRAEVELHKAHAQLNHLLEHSPAVIYALKVEGESVAPYVVSENITALLGFTVSETLHYEWWLRQIHPDDRDRTVASLSETLTHGTSHTEYRLRHKDGSYRWVEDKRRLLRDTNGRPMEIVGLWSDITARKKLEDQFRQSQKMESIGQLAGGVAHDFNNILAVIEMQSCLLKSCGKLSPEQSEYADEISTSVKRGAALTRQLLLFSRREVFQPRDLDLSESIASTTKMLQRILGENIQMQLKLAAQPMFIHADAGMLDQVLMNLTVNARDAMPNGGRLIIETAGVEIDEFAASQSAQMRVGSFVRLSVSDSGCGISPEIIQKIFEPFFTTKGVGKGTGLGLATVFGIVQQHQGWINVYSEVNQGTAFRVYLPRLTKAGGIKSAPPALTSIRGGSETILLVEDDSSLRIAVQKALSKFGYRILEVPNGVKALEVWKENRNEIRLLLTDLVMPDEITGKDLAQNLLQENPRLKVIFMSGYSAEIIGKDFPLKEGVNFLTKPFQASKLAQTIRESLDAKNGLLIRN